MPQTDPNAGDAPDYETRRRHIRRILYAIGTEIRTVVKWTGREKRSQYDYVHQVISGRPGKRSPKVLDDMEETLKEKGYWVEYGELDLSETVPG